MKWITLLIEQLNQDYPQWWIEWADCHELQNIARGARPEAIQSSIAQRLFPHILNCAICSDIVRGFNDA